LAHTETVSRVLMAFSLLCSLSEYRIENKARCTQEKLEQKMCGCPSGSCLEG